MRRRRAPQSPGTGKTLPTVRAADEDDEDEDEDWMMTLANYAVWLGAIIIGISLTMWLTVYLDKTYGWHTSAIFRLTELSHL